MQNPNTALPPPPTKPFDWFSAAQLFGSLLSALTLFLTALLLLLAGLISINDPMMDTLSIWLLLGTCLAGALLVLPSSWLAARKLLGRPANPLLPENFPSRAVLLALLLGVLPLALIAGSLVIQFPAISWLLLPPLQLIAVGTPILALIYLGCNGLPGGSSQRKWGLFNSGMILAPVLAITLEIVLGIVLVTVVMVYLFSQPDVADEMMWLIEQYASSPAISPDALIEIMLPYLQSPFVIFAALSFIAVLVPMMEEAIKPIGLWLLAGRKLTPAEGFTAGLLSGAGFALMETLGYSSASTESWMGITLARNGTAVMHMVTTALVSWALASTWQDRQWRRLIVTYLAAVIIHGLWNALSVGIGALSLTLDSFVNYGIYVQMLGSLLMGLVLLALLLRFKARLRREIASDDNPAGHAIIPLPFSDVEITLPQTTEEE